MKRIYGVILLMVLIPLTVFAGELVVGDNTFKMNVAGEAYESENPILNVNQNTYLPLRELSELFGKAIDYKDNTIIIDTQYPKNNGGSNDIQYKIKSSKYPDAKQSTAKIIIGGKEYKISNPAIIVNGSTYLSLRELADIFNEKIEFAKGAIYIKGGAPEEAPKEMPVIIPQKAEEGPQFTVENELVLKSNGELWAFGNNKDGRLSKSIKDEYITSPAKIMEGVKSIFYDGLRYFIIKQDHTLWQLPIRERYDSGTEEDFALKKVMGNVAKVNKGTIITRDGQVYVYGLSREIISDGFSKAIGVPKSEIRSLKDNWKAFDFEYHKVEGLEGAKDAMYEEELEPGPNGFGGGYVAESLIILKEDNSLWGCYDYNYGSDVQWGEIDSIHHIMDNVKSLESVGHINAVIKADSSLWAWGATIYGAFGRDFEDEVRVPMKLLDNVKNTNISYMTSFAVTNNNELYTWGINQMYSYHKANAGGIEKIASSVEKVVPGIFYFVALKTDGTVWMYGIDPGAEIEESYDEQGNYIAKDKDMIGAFGTADVVKNIGQYKYHSAEPLKGAIDIGTNSYPGVQTYALKPDGTIWVWGLDFILDGDKDEGDLSYQEKKRTRIPRPWILN